MARPAFRFKFKKALYVNVMNHFLNAPSGDRPTDINGGHGSGRARDRGLAIRVSFAAAPGWWNW
jgi:hypothetical protein